MESPYLCPHLFSVLLWERITQCLLDRAAQRRDPSHPEGKSQGESKVGWKLFCWENLATHIFAPQSPALDCTQRRQLLSESVTDELRLIHSPVSLSFLPQVKCGSPTLLLPKSLRALFSKLMVKITPVTSSRCTALVPLCSVTLEHSRGWLWLDFQTGPQQLS